MNDLDVLNISIAIPGYRFVLLREIEQSLPDLLERDRGTCAFIMANPSTADSVNDDPTIRRCIGYARSWRYSRLVVGNVNPTRGTDPRMVPPTVARRIGWINDLSLETIAEAADLVVCAWGLSAAPALADRAVDILIERADLHVLKTTRDKIPAHPLYLPKDLQPVLWRPRRVAAPGGRSPGHPAVGTS